MSVAIVTGAAGLVGAAAVKLFADRGLDVIGIDNDMRKVFFGEAASTAWNRDRLKQTVARYRHEEIDIRDRDRLNALFARYGRDIAVILHAAAQPSHDWAAQDPFMDFTINANGTLTLLEAFRAHCPDAVFLNMSTNKVYGDAPNALPLIEEETRWAIDPGHRFARYGIDETMSIDASVHSLFGVSKAAGDLLTQEYGRNFGLKTACFRGGCLTGPAHSGAQLHGFLAYLARCAVVGTPYTIFGYKGKQVRDNLHSDDLARAFWAVFEAPRAGEVYNMGGGTYAHCSVLEAIALCERITGREMDWRLDETNRTGDHIWYISDLRRFQTHYPDWRPQHTMETMAIEIIDALQARLA
ncbi:MAG: NAD-dependent epimerase/dehydratase family protein [Rickettsiales bacterium]